MLRVPQHVRTSKLCATNAYSPLARTDFQTLCYKCLQSLSTYGLPRMSSKQGSMYIFQLGITIHAYKYFSKRSKTRLLSKHYNIALLKIPLTQFFKRRGQGKSKSYKHMAKSIECTSQNKSCMHANDLGILQKLSQIKTKHSFLSRENMLGNYQVQAEVPHLLAEVWPRWPHSRK